MSFRADGTVVLAHGLGGREDIPAPTWLAMYAGAVAVLVSFFALAALWAAPRLKGRTAGRPVPLLERLAGAPGTGFLLRVVGVALLAIFLAVAWGGPDDNGRANPAPTWIYVFFWVGLVPVSLLLGPVWRRMNPLRTISEAIRLLVRRGPRPLPARVGYWPAVVSLMAFLWLELAYDHAASPRAVAAFVTAYVVIHVTLGVVFGSVWFSRGDGFEVYATTIARLSLLGRRQDGRIVVRNPLDGLAGAPTSPDVTPVVLTALGSTAFDGLARTDFWADLIAGAGRAEYLLLGTAGLAAGMLAMSATYLLAIRLTRRLVPGEPQLRAMFAASIIPIAVGYTVAHYFSFALFQGQQGFLLANDPFVRGDDLFGLADRNPNYDVISSDGISLVQIGAIVVGHVIAVVASHDRAAGLLPARHLRAGQYPMLVLMVLYTMTGIALVSGAG